MTMIQNNNRKLSLAGNLNTGGSPFLSDLSLDNVPIEYTIINIDSAVLTSEALLNFKYSHSNLNIPMVKDSKLERNTKVLLSIGGENGNFNYLEGADKVTNFFNSLSEFYTDWGFNGFNFDIRQLNSENMPYIIRAIQWFREDHPEALLSLTAQATDVSADAGGMFGKWNRLVPLINQLRNSLDWIQIAAYGYGSAFEEIASNRPPSPTPPASPPPAPADSAFDGPIPIDDPKGMLEYIFTSFVKPFIFSNPGTESELMDVTGYYGFDGAKLLLGVLPIGFLGPEYYVDPETLKQVIADLKDKYNIAAGGVAVSSINDDARNIYDFSTRFTQKNDG